MLCSLFLTSFFSPRGQALAPYGLSSRSILTIQLKYTCTDQQDVVFRFQFSTSSSPVVIRLKACACRDSTNFFSKPSSVSSYLTYIGIRVPIPSGCRAWHHSILTISQEFGGSASGPKPDSPGSPQPFLQGNLSLCIIANLSPLPNTVFTNARYRQDLREIGVYISSECRGLWIIFRSWTKDDRPEFVGWLWSASTLLQVSVQIILDSQVGEPGILCISNFGLLV